MSKTHERVGITPPVHYMGKNGPTPTRCGVQKVGDADISRVTCRKCFTILGRSIWRLQLEKTPGTWIDTPTLCHGIQRPKLIPFDKSGRATRWINVCRELDW